MNNRTSSTASNSNCNFSIGNQNRGFKRPAMGNNNNHHNSTNAVRIGFVSILVILAIYSAYSFTFLNKNGKNVVSAPKGIDSWIHNSETSLSDDNNHNQNHKHHHKHKNKHHDDEDENFSVRILTPLQTKIGSTELFYMIPKPRRLIKGILIFFHGCHHGGIDFFRLPEDRRVAYAAMERNLAVVSITSKNRKTGCWTSDDDHKNLKMVFDIWLHDVKLNDTLPRIGMGASSGGSTLFTGVYKILKLQSMASYVMWKTFSEEDLSQPNAASILPATAFVYMPADPKAKDIVPQHAKALVQKGIPTRVFAVQPHPLTPEMCGMRIPEMGLEQCRTILKSQQNTELMDENYNVLIPNKGGAWDHVFDKAKLNAKVDKDNNEEYETFNGQSWLSAALTEELAVSYGVHEMTSEYRHEVLDFLMKHAGIGD